MPAVCPTVPGELDPPAQPETYITSSIETAAAIQTRRRRTTAKLMNSKAASSDRSCGKILSRKLSSGIVRGPGTVPAFDGAVVVTVVVTVVGVFSGNELGVVEQDPVGGAPLQETVTAPLNPPDGERIIVNVAACPAATVAEVDAPGAVVIVKSVPLESVTK